MNYSELVDASTAYADRNDIEVDDNIDTFILMAEARINRVLKTRKQSTRSFIQTNDKEYYCLPSDFASMRDIQVNSAAPGSTSYQMKYLSPEQFNKVRNQPFCGQYFYSVIADQIQVYPIMPIGQTIEIVYFQKVPNLNAVNQTNWLSNDHPDIYLSGITAEIELFVKNYEVADGWKDRMTVAIGELYNTDVEEKWGGPSMQIRLG